MTERRLQQDELRTVAAAALHGEFAGGVHFTHGFIHGSFATPEKSFCLQSKASRPSDGRRREVQMAQNVIRKAFDPLAAALVSSASAPAEHGKVYVCGSTEHGAAGHTGPAAAPAKSHSRKHLHEEHHAPLRTPHLLTTLVETQVAQVSCGWQHSVFVLSDGELYACGDNEYGKCGFGDTAARPEPTRVPIPLQVGAPPSHVVRVATVSCGRSHSAFVCTVGELYTFGLGLYGQLGHRTLTAQTTPRRVDGLGGPVVSVSCGGLHTLLVRADGRALSCGFNDSGRL